MIEKMEKIREFSLRCFLFLERRVKCFVVMGSPAIRSYRYCLATTHASTQHSDTTSIRASWSGHNPQYLNRIRVLVAKKSRKQPKEPPVPCHQPLVTRHLSPITN